jgi:uncharacterized protein YdaU (DUF1376 family)
MSFAYMPWYTGDYLRDTRHLSPMKHGVYLLLLAHCWDQKGPVPLDEQEAAGIANCRSIDEVEALRYILDRYFVRMDDGHYNKRMQAEIVRAESISVKREDAGRRGANERMRRFREAQATAKQELSNCQASAKQVTLSPSPSPSLNQKDKEQDAANAADVWAYGTDLLTKECGLSDRQARSFLGGLCKLWPEATVFDAMLAATGKADPKAYARKWLDCQPRKGQRRRSAGEELMAELQAKGIE